MKIYVYPADQTGCGYYRLIWPSMALRQAGVDVTIVTDKKSPFMFHGRMINDQMMDVTTPPDADVIVLQRPMSRYLAQAIPLMRQKGITVIVDMDDDLSSIDPRNPAFQIMHPRMGNSEFSWQHVMTACDNATMITVSTPALLDVYARRTRGSVIFNYVPRYFTEWPHDDVDVVGWGGAVFSHPDDLQELGPAISRIVREFGMFRLVGPGDHLDQVMGASLVEKIHVTGKVEFLEWYKALADNLGIGVAPTSNTKFNRSKSWLKPLEYAATGVVPVSSERVEYVRLKRDFGLGMIASSPKDWFRTVKRLVDDTALRMDMSAAGREIVREHLTIEGNIQFWHDAWTAAVAIQRKQPVRAA